MVSTDEIMEAFHERLRENGLKSTRQRDLIARKFFELDKHISVDELLAELRKDAPRLGYATVYRTLKLLVEQGFASARQFDDGHTRYDAHFSDDPHDHIICVDCRRIVEFDNDEITALLMQEADRVGFQFKRRRLELYGLCSECRDA